MKNARPEGQGGMGEPDTCGVTHVIEQPLGLLAVRGPSCAGCGAILDRDYVASPPFDTEYDCHRPVSQAEIAWPCYACDSLQHDRPSAGTACGCNETWFRQHAASLKTIGFAAPAPFTSSTPAQRASPPRQLRRPVPRGVDLG